jgi:hypothetical protein
MRTFVTIALLCSTCSPCGATCDLDRVVSYTLVASKTIAGYIQDDQRKDEFSGCEFGRILVFDDNTGVRCAGYSYQYAYRPTAYIFANSYAIKLCIDGSWFDAAPLR